MTLLVSLYTSQGIVFAADSAITRDGRRGIERLPKQEKFLKTSRVGVSGGLVGYFGLAEVGAEPMSVWLRRVLDRWNGSLSVGDLGNYLCDALNEAVPDAHRHGVPSGFHIGAFETRAGSPVPVFRYVWNYRDLDEETGVYSGFSDYQSDEHFPRGQAAFADLSPARMRQGLRAWETTEGVPFWFRNGELAFSAQAWHGLTWAIRQVVRNQSHRGFALPDDLARWEQLADSLVRTNGRLFAMLKQEGPPTIEGPYRKASIPWP